jgi:hypothetical protein
MNLTYMVFRNGIEYWQRNELKEPLCISTFCEMFE